MKYTNEDSTEKDALERASDAINSSVNAINESKKQVFPYIIIYI